MMVFCQKCGAEAEIYNTPSAIIGGVYASGSLNYQCRKCGYVWEAEKMIENKTKMPYTFDLLCDLKTETEIVQAYRLAVEMQKTLKTILHQEINGTVRNNGLCLKSIEIDGPDTHQALIRILVAFNQIDADLNESQMLYDQHSSPHLRNSN